MENNLSKNTYIHKYIKWNHFSVHLKHCKYTFIFFFK